MAKSSTPVSPGLLLISSLLSVCSLRLTCVQAKGWDMWLGVVTDKRCAFFVYLLMQNSCPDLGSVLNDLCPVMLCPNVTLSRPSVPLSY